MPTNATPPHEGEARRRGLARLQDDLRRLRESIAALRTETGAFLEIERTRRLTAAERARRTRVRLAHEGLLMELRRLAERFQELRGPLPRRGRG
jgi:hypothetical protein